MLKKEDMNFDPHLATQDRMSGRNKVKNIIDPFNRKRARVILRGYTQL